MRYEAISTKASGFEYGVSVPQFESFDEAVEVIEGGEEGIVEILNSDMNQNAKQGPKKQVREAVEAAVDAGFDTDSLESALEEADALEDEEREEYLGSLPDEASAVIAAVDDARELAREYRIGRPRGSGDGLTKTKSREIGAQLKERLGDEELLRLAQEHGIDPDAL